MADGKENPPFVENVETSKHDDVGGEASLSSPIDENSNIVKKVSPPTSLVQDSSIKSDNIFEISPQREIHQMWQEIVLNWLHCFEVGPISNINDVKQKNFVPTSEENVPPFHRLLSYLQSRYPHFDSNLIDPDHVSWSQEQDLFLLATLLLLDASRPQEKNEPFINRTLEILSTAEQPIVVEFLTKALNFDLRNLTKNNLIECVQPSEGASPESPSPVPTTTLSDFLLSPIASQEDQKEIQMQTTANSANSANTAAQESLQKKLQEERERGWKLEDDLQQERMERNALLTKVCGLQTQISELGNKYKVAVEEVEALAEKLQKAAAMEGHDFHAERQELRSKLANSVNYAQELEIEIEKWKTDEQTLKSKLLKSEESAKSLEDNLKVCMQELASVKGQMELYSEENTTLRTRLSRLEQDVTQMQSSSMISPMRPGQDITSPTSSCTAENLAFIIEERYIAKEEENNQLKETLKELQTKLNNLKFLQEKSLTDVENAARSQKRVETSLANTQSELDETHQELASCKRVIEEQRRELEDVEIKRNRLDAQVSELASLKSALETDKKALQDKNSTLEVEAAKQRSQLVIASEREEELHNLLKMKSAELYKGIEDMDNMEGEMKKAVKEREMMEQQLKDVVEKLDVAKKVQAEKSDLEDEVIDLKKTCEKLKSKLESSNIARSGMSEKLQFLLKEKKVIECQLEDAISKIKSLTTSLDQVSAEKETAMAEKVALLKEKVHWEARLSQVQRYLKEAKEEISPKEREDNILKDNLAELLASNELSISTQQEKAETSTHKKVAENQLPNAKLEAAEKISECESMADPENLETQPSAASHETLRIAQVATLDLAEEEEEILKPGWQRCPLHREPRLIDQEVLLCGKAINQHNSWNLKVHFDTHFDTKYFEESFLNKKFKEVFRKGFYKRIRTQDQTKT